MEVKISIFDILSYLMPGFLYLFSIVFIADSFVQQDLITPLLNPTTPQIIAMLIIAYILGHALQSLYRANPLLYFYEDKRHKGVDLLLKNINSDVAKNYKKFGYSNRAILENILQLHNENLAHTASRFLAMYTFLRNLSFPFFLLSITTILRNEYIGFHLSIYLSLILFAMSILSLHRAQKYKNWANSTVTEGIIALSLNKSDFFTKNQPILFEEDNN